MVTVSHKKMCSKEEMQLERPTSAFFKEVTPPLSFMTAIEEASRCLLCHDAPCSRNCPAGTDPARFIRSLRFKNLHGAVETIRSNNILGASCARVCPFGRLCEKACSRTGIDTPIAIGRLQRFITDYEQARKLETVFPCSLSKEKVAVIGSGPGGLSVAANLALKGYPVTVFEKKPKLGGVLTYGIAPSRLPREVVEFEIGYIKDLGVEFELGCEVGCDFSLLELEKQGYEAIVLALGLQKSKTLSLPGMEYFGVYHALQFLEEARVAQEGMNLGHTVIIGGGDVAMDCASTAKHLGKKVTLVYRRRKEDMPAYKEEVAHIQSLGVDFITEAKPIRILGEKGKVTHLVAESTDTSSVYSIGANHVVFALGQELGDTLLPLGLKKTEQGFILVDEKTGETSQTGVFAVGDGTGLERTVVGAVGHGKKVAHGVDQFLEKKRKKEQ